MHLDRAQFHLFTWVKSALQTSLAAVPCPCHTCRSCCRCPSRRHSRLTHLHVTGVSHAHLGAAVQLHAVGGVAEARGKARQVGGEGALVAVDGGAAAGNALLPLPNPIKAPVQ